MKNRICGIYGLRCRSTGLWYVGLSKDMNRRWRMYRALGCKAQVKLYNAIMKYGINDFEFHILEECQEEFLNEKECIWILSKDSLENGYNLTAGGGSKTTFSKESREKMRQSHLGQPSARKGYKVTEEERERMRQISLGRKHSDETKKLLSELGKKNVGERNGSYGKFYITNGVSNAKIRTGEQIPEGWRRGKVVSDETREKIRIAGTGKKQSKETIKKRTEGVKDLIWITNSSLNRRINKDSVIPEGWRRGKTNGLHRR